MLPYIAASQQYATRTFSIDDGLPSNRVNCIYQDSLGRLWVGTDAGIGIFDGLDFKIITKKDGLASNDVRAITQDEAGNFWFACYAGGVTKYDGRNFRNLTTKDGLTSILIRCLYYSKTYKTLFIGADDGFYTLKDGKHSFFGKSNGKLYEKHEILWFLEGKGFVYVFPFHDYVIRFYPQTGQCRSLKEVGASQERWKSLTSALVTSDKDTVWGNSFTVSTQNGIKRLDYATSALIFDLCEDNRGDIWLPLWGSVNDGIVKYDGKSVIDQTNALGLQNVKCTSVLYDKTGNQLWIGTDGSGIRAVPLQYFTYFKLPNTKEKEQPIKLFIYQGNLNVLYKSSISGFDPNGKSQVIPVNILEISDAGQLIARNKAVWGKKNKGTRQTELWRLPEFYDIAFDELNQPWVSTTVGFFRLSDDLSKVSKSLVFDIRYGTIGFDSLGTLYNWGYWLPNLNIVHSPETQKSYSAVPQFSQDNTDLPKEISKMLPVGRKMMFSSLNGGLYLTDGKTFFHLNKSCPELPDNISDICLTLKGEVAYCTNTGEAGIGRLRQDKFEVLFKLDNLDGAFGRNFLWVISDTKNNVYFGTNKGLLVLHNPDVISSKVRDVRFFSKPEGYRDISAHSPVVDAVGNIWLVSPLSIIRIDTKSLTERSHTQPKVLLSSLKTSDSTYIFNSIESEHKLSEILSFPYSSSNLTFNFANINLLNPEKDRFSVQLEGFDKEFKDVGNKRTVEYTNLPAGKYRLVVRVFNINTLVRHSQILLEFRIKPPFWQTWWFNLLVVISIISFVVGFYRLRISQVRKTAQTKLEMVELEMQALQSQMNPHFFFNVMNSLQRYILERDTDKGIGLLGNINSMIRQTFELASKKTISLKEEVTYLDSYLKLEQVRSGNKFQYEISIDPSLSQSDSVIPPMLIQPMVENAVKHGLMPLDGNDGLLQISFTRKDEKSFCCTIADNGIGIKNSLESKRDASTRLSKALNITQRRIELLKRNNRTANYSIAVIDRCELTQKEQGTTVEIILPL